MTALSEDLRCYSAPVLDGSQLPIISAPRDLMLAGFHRHRNTCRIKYIYINIQALNMDFKKDRIDL